ncbi:LTA synthase family protein [Clostridium fermenticellae]|uniref:LTA synthase family protein n=1 Tax=Clostridium fermenticellae TaxID=2068654 RepID=A0A386H797_9CLOT|nr:LTA synthase family protein [Clostridium fermenticellae]AYD41468.1 LTA synthase family protein [Clostridium fermenticellae]
MSIKMLVYGSQIQIQYFSYKRLYPKILASILVICGFGLIFKKRKRITFLYISSIVLTSLIFADLIYFQYFRDIISISILENGLLLGPVKSSVASLLKWQYFLLFIDIVLLPGIIFKLMIEKENTLKVRIISTVVVLAIGLGYSAKYVYKLSVEQPNLITTMYNRIYIAETLGNLDFHVLDVYNFAYRTIKKGTPLPIGKQNEIKHYFGDNNKNSEGILNGDGNGKNLIVIQVEALQQFVINKTLNGKEITPNLNAWIKKSAYFDNYFYQVSAGNTSDAELMTNNSLYPASQGAAAYMYCKNDFDSLPKMLEKKGYTSIALHGFRGDFWNRNIMNKAEGYDKFYSESSFKVDDVVGLGLSDKSFLNQSLNIIRNQKQPFFSFLVTLSSHYPFDDVKNYGNFNTSEYEGTLLGNYIKSIHYTDEQIGMFLKKLDDSGLTKDSIIVIYGDHYAIPKNQDKSLYKFLNIDKGNDLNWMELQKVPLIIHFPDNKNSGIYHAYSGEMDLYPTLSNLYNLSSKYMFGSDIFNTKDNLVVFRNGSFTDGKVFYLSQLDKYYDIKTGEAISENSKILNEKSLTQKELEYSDDILNHNLIKKFNKK